LAVLRELMAQLPGEVNDLSNAGGSYRVAACLQAARDIDGDLTAQAGLPG